MFEVKDKNEALMIGNDTEFGLGASIWSQDFDRARSMADKIEAGLVNINHGVFSMPELPFGGAKKSGIG
jgi:succinate-semialdehyde dehydrogenase / glutarate-semialdehyde dehydrogenase